MKRSVRLILSMLLIACVLVPIYGVASATETKTSGSHHKATVVSSWSISADSDCSHPDAHIELGDVVAETCTYTTRNFTETCNICGESFRGGTVNIHKDPPEHTMRWYTVSCINGIHTYENRCSKCGYASESFSRPCSGPPCPEELSLGR